MQILGEFSWAQLSLVSWEINWLTHRICVPYHAIAITCSPNLFFTRTFQPTLIFLLIKFLRKLLEFKNQYSNVRSSTILLKKCRNQHFVQFAKTSSVQHSPYCSTYFFMHSFFLIMISRKLFLFSNILLNTF